MGLGCGGAGGGCVDLVGRGFGRGGAVLNDRD